MPKSLDEDRVRRKELLAQKRLARKVAKEAEEQQQHQLTVKQNDESSHDGSQRSAKRNQQDSLNGNEEDTFLQQLLLQHVNDDSLHNIYLMLSAIDLGRLILTARPLNQLLSTARVAYLQSRLGGQHLFHTHDDMTAEAVAVGMCENQAEAQQILRESLIAGGDTGRIIARSKKWQQLQEYNQFVHYARFLEQAVNGYCLLRQTTTARDGTVIPIRLPTFCHGRIVSVSPEHSVCRVGGLVPLSGVATWGIGKRGQLGHGKRQDEQYPTRLRYGIGYTPPSPPVRIVQVAAGGGLVRVAHTLLLTETGKVLSFGTGQYGALGHGYSAAKQLPDYLRPTYIEALSPYQIVCVAAGELHSAAVTADGDLYTWGDGFCGQLGHGNKRPLPSPEQVCTGGLEEECVANVSCGSRHTLVVTEDGDVYSFGLGHFGVLGRSYTPFEYDADESDAYIVFGDPQLNRNNDVQDGILPTIGRPRPPSPPAMERDEMAELAAHLDLINNLTLEDASDQCIAKKIDSMQGIRIIGSSAGHRHSLLLDAQGGLYSFGSGTSGCLGHGDTLSQMFPCRIQALDEENVKIRRMSAGVDITMAVSTAGHVYAFGKTDGGRIGLGMTRNSVTIPRLVSFGNDKNKYTEKAVDVECGYAHALIVALSGTLYECGGVGVHGADDGQQNTTTDHELDNPKVRDVCNGRPRLIQDFNVWHRIPEPEEEQAIKKERWKKYGKYEVKGRSKMLNGDD